MKRLSLLGCTQHIFTSASFIAPLCPSSNKQAQFAWIICSLYYYSYTESSIRELQSIGSGYLPRDYTSSTWYRACLKGHGPTDVGLSLQQSQNGHLTYTWYIGLLHALDLLNLSLWALHGLRTWRPTAKHLSTENAKRNDSRTWMVIIIGGLFLVDRMKRWLSSEVARIVVRCNARGVVLGAVHHGR